MRVSLFAPFVLIVPLFAAACGDDPVPVVPAPPPPPVAAADFMDAYAQAICTRSSRCFAASSYLDAVCEGTVRRQFGEDVESAIAAGRIDYDANAAGVCLVGLEAMDCLAKQPSDATLEACLRALAGTIEVGQACFGTFQCAQGICPSVTGDACGPTCPTIALEGEACSLLSEPECDVRAGLRCSSGTCVAPAARGAACVDNYGCQSGLVCVANVCVPLRAAGQGCAQDSSCQTGFYCASGGDEGGICRARLDAGSACGGIEAEYTNAAFRHVQCKDGLICELAELQADGTTLGGICEAPREVGGNCTPRPPNVQLFETGCKLGLVCDAGKCAWPPAVGMACGPNFTCAIGAYCDDNTNQCVALKPEGDVCAFDNECAGGYCGSSGKCTALETFCGP